MSRWGSPMFGTATTPLGVFVGLTVLDLVHHVDEPPRPNQKITANRQFLAAGGPAANAAITFAAMGGSARLITALGNSAPALVARQDLESHGVEIIDFAPPEFELSVSAVAVTKSTGDRSVISTDAGRIRVSAGPLEASNEKNAELGASGIRTRGLADLLEPAHVLLVDGHHPDLAIAALKFYRDAPINGRPQSPITERIMDAGRWKPHHESILPHTDTVICSADFAAPESVAQLPKTSSDQLLPSSLFNGSRFARTGGEHPIIWWQRDRRNGQTHGQVKPPHVKAVDTLGAGDIFHGAYAYYAALALANQLILPSATQPRTQQGPTPTQEARQGTESDQASAPIQPEPNFADLLKLASKIAAHRVQSLGPRNWIGTLPTMLGHTSLEC